MTFITAIITFISIITNYPQLAVVYVGTSRNHEVNLTLYNKICSVLYSLGRINLRDLSHKTFSGMTIVCRVNDLFVWSIYLPNSGPIMPHSIVMLRY